MFQHILEEIRSASDINGLYPALARLVNEASKTIYRDNFSYEEAREVAECLDHVRIIITALEQAEGAEGESKRHLRMTNYLSRLTCDMEGKLKEIRNDLRRRQ